MHSEDIQVGTWLRLRSLSGPFLNFQFDKQRQCALNTIAVIERLARCGERSKERVAPSLRKLRNRQSRFRSKEWRENRHHMLELVKKRTVLRL
jgi:hypothetical protein